MPVRFFSMRVTSEGNNTQIVVAIVGVIVVDVDAVAVSVAEIHKLAVRGKGCFLRLSIQIRGHNGAGASYRM